LGQVLGLALCAAGCVNYSPRTPHSVATAGVRLRPQRIHMDLLNMGFTTTVDVLEVSPERRVSEVALVRATEPCGGRGRRLAYEITGSDRVRRNVLIPGSALVVTIPTKEWDQLDDLPARIDLRLETAAGESSCISLPWFSDAPEDQWEIDQRWAFFERFAYRRWSMPLGGLDYRFDLSLGVGYWMSDVFVAASVGFQLVECPAATCPLVPDIRKEKMVEQSLAGPVFGLEANTWPLQTGLLTGGVAARYVVRQMSVSRYGGTENEWLQGPELVPHIGLAEHKWLAAGVPGGPHHATIDLEAPLGLIISGGGRVRASYGVGLNLKALFPW
jgi:hypothetical protein